MDSSHHLNNHMLKLLKQALKKHSLVIIDSNSSNMRQFSTNLTSMKFNLKSRPVVMCMGAPWIQGGRLMR